MAKESGTSLVSPTCKCAETRQMLGRLPAVVLRRLLKEKKVLGRSKLKAKDVMIRALEGLIDAADIDLVLLQARPRTETIVAETIAQSKHDGSMLYLEGNRWEEPVMGIDVHKVTLAFAIATPAGVIKEGLTENTLEGLAVLVQACRLNQVAIVAMESTAEFWLLPYWTLQDAGIKVIVANPLQVKATQGIKTDRLDARRITLALRDGRLKPSVACDREQYALRKAMRELVTQTELKTQAVNRLKQIFHKASAPDLVEKAIDSQRGLSILAALPGCCARDELYTVVQVAFSQHKGMIVDPAELDKITSSFWAFLQRVDINRDRQRFVLILDEIVMHKAKIAELERVGLEYARQHREFLDDLKLVLTIPCVGLHTALAILAEIVDIRYFSMAFKLAKWAGIVPSTHQSGYRKRVHGKIYKGGNKYLRRACWLAADNDYAKAGGPGHRIGQFITHLIIDKKKPVNVAITGGAHKLLTIIHAMLTRKQSFTIINDDEARTRQEKNSQRKIHELERKLESLSISEVVPRFVKYLKAHVIHYQEIESEVQAIESALLGDIAGLMIDSGGD